MLLEVGLLGVLLAILSVLLFVDFGGESSRVADEIFNFGHLPLFGAAALVILWLLGGRRWPVHGRRHYVSAFFAALALGVISEFVQLFTPERYFEVQDMAYDALGALAFLVLAYPFPGLSRKRAAGWKAAGVGVIAAAMVPMGLTALDTWRMNREFPLIGSFETRLEMGRWAADGCRVARSGEHASHGVYALKADLSPGEYPGISSKWLEGDWRGYSELCFDVFLEGDSPLAMTVRIHDKAHDRLPEQRYSDRFNRRFMLNPGAQEIRIDLDEVRTAPAGREMDMGRIVNICVFAYRLKAERAVFFDNFRLEGPAEQACSGAGVPPAEGRSSGALPSVGEKFSRGVIDQICSEFIKSIIYSLNFVKSPRFSFSMV